MAKVTQQQAICNALIARGESEVVPSASRKYRQFTNTNSVRPGGFWWVGKAGGLRLGQNVTRSYSLPENFRQRLMYTGGYRLSPPPGCPVDREGKVTEEWDGQVGKY